MPRSPFDDGFDGKVGDVVEGSQTPAPTPAAPVAPVAPVAKVNAGAAKDGAPKSVAPPLRKANAPVNPTVAETPAPAYVAAPVSAPIATAEANTLNQLLQYLILKEGREAAAAEQLEERRKQIQRQRDRNAKDQDTKYLLKQARCRHLKGGKKGPKTQNKDYAVYQHRMINFEESIKCRICGMKWLREDTAEYLVRVDKHGTKRKIANHTHKGWREALEMCEASTDTASASEAVPTALPNASNLDSAGIQFETRLVDKDTGELLEGISI